MQKKRYTGYIAGAVLVLLGIIIIVTYNSLVKKEEVVKKQWSEVQNTYQRRLDLIPNLVNVVKGLSDFEQTTLEKIAASLIIVQKLFRLVIHFYLYPGQKGNKYARHSQFVSHIQQCLCHIALP